MNYYIIKESKDPKIVGNDFAQVYKFIKNYNQDAPNAFCSLYKYKNSFPDYIPDLDGLMAANSAKLTDFVSHAFGPFLFIMSEKAQCIMEQYNLCPHRFYPIGLYKRKVKYDYFLLMTLIPRYIDFVDYKKSTFVEYNISSGEIFNTTSIISKEDLFQKREIVKAKTGKSSQTIWGDKIIMNKDFDKELDFFSIYIIDENNYVSERLKNAIESNGLVGWEFFPANNLIVP